MTKEPAQIIVDRYKSEADWTLSEFIINGLNNVVKKGFGVEDEKRDVKVAGETRIDNDVYEIEFVDSPTFSSSYYMDKDGYLSQVKTERFNKPHLLLHVMNVKNFLAILWHWGNTDKDTRGCYIVGSTLATFDKRKGVGGSRAKYVEIYPVIYQLYIARKAQGLKTFVEYRDKLAA